MRRNLLRNLLFLGVVLLLIGVSFTTVRLVVRAGHGPLVPLKNHISPLTQQAKVLQTANSSQQLNLSIGLQFRNQNVLNNLLSALNNPASPLYHHYLTPGQFKQRFAPTDDQVHQVVDFMQSQGMKVTHVAPNNLLINVSTTVAQAEQAFQVKINNYQLGKRSFFANASAPQVPDVLSPLIVSVGGLDNSVHYEPRYQRIADQGKDVGIPRTPSGYGPQDIAAAYDIAALHDAGFMGDNQTIALLELDGYQLTDIAQYMLYYGLGSLPSITPVLVDGFNGLPGAGAIEDELDMEILAAVAPHASQIIYEGPNSDQGFNDTANKIVTDNLARNVSISWGSCELVSGSANMQTLNNIFKQGIAQGMAFFAASGDSGAYDCQDDTLMVDTPASDPNVTAVGGTTLQMNAGAYSSEIAWSNPLDELHGPHGSGSGGGLSTVYAQPSWQSGPGVQNSYSNGKRELPDVAANADPTTGYAVFCTVLVVGCPLSGWVRIGGTSAGAPLWAASAALINSYLQSQGKAPLSLVNPALYGLFNAQQAFPAYHDITSGNNNFYPATANYDLTTGMGSPDVYNIARDLAMGSTLGQDTFNRADRAYWGTSSDGHAWTGDASSNSAYSISRNTGRVAGGGTTSALMGPVVQNAEVVLTGSLSTFASSNFGAVLHWNDNGNWYKAYLDGSQLIVQRKLNGTATTLSQMSFSATAGTAYTLRFRMVGTTLYAKAWNASQSEPSTWMITTTDTSFSTGYCGMRMTLQSTTVATFTSFQVVTAQ